MNISTPILSSLLSKIRMGTTKYLPFWQDGGHRSWWRHERSIWHLWAPENYTEQWKLVFLYFIASWINLGWKKANMFTNWYNSGRRKLWCHQIIQIKVVFMQNFHRYMKIDISVPCDQLNNFKMKSAMHLCFLARWRS